jgi:diaminopimelate epimerase
MSLLENKSHSGWLMSGAGNTFAIEITNDGDLVNKAQAKLICEKYKVDGYLGLIQKDPHEFRWNFFNSDGSDAEFCGNAARCAQDFLKKQKASTHTKHQTKAGTVLSWTDETQNWVLMPKPQILETAKIVEIDGQPWKGLWCNTGVPHFVLEQPKLRHDVWFELSKKLRNDPSFGIKGSNITWVKMAEGKVMAVTYERGVEDFTQACGTGAFAAALWWQMLNQDQKRFEISMPGGLLVVVPHETGWMMTGPVEKFGDWSTT